MKRELCPFNTEDSFFKRCQLLFLRAEHHKKRKLTSGSTQSLATGSVAGRMMKSWISVSTERCITPISERSWKNSNLELSGPGNKADKHQSPEAKGPVATSYRSCTGMGLPRRWPNPNLSTTVRGPPGQGFTSSEQLSHTSTALAFLQEVVYIQSSISKNSLFPPHNPALRLNTNMESSMRPPTFKTSSAEPAVCCSSEEEPQQRLQISK